MKSKLRHKVSMFDCFISGFYVALLLLLIIIYTMLEV